MDNTQSQNPTTRPIRKLLKTVGEFLAPGRAKDAPAPATETLHRSYSDHGNPSLVTPPSQLPPYPVILFSDDGKSNTEKSH